MQSGVLDGEETHEKAPERARAVRPKSPGAPLAVANPAFTPPVNERRG